MATVQELVDDAACFCGLSNIELLRIVAYTTAVNAGMSTDPQTLVTAAKCYCGLSNVELLRIIAQNTSTGGGTGNAPVVYTTDPNVEGLTPTNTSAPAVAYSADGSGAVYGWSVASQLWV